LEPHQLEAAAAVALRRVPPLEDYPDRLDFEAGLPVRQHLVVDQVRQAVEGYPPVAARYQQPVQVQTSTAVAPRTRAAAQRKDLPTQIDECWIQKQRHAQVLVHLQATSPSVPSSAPVPQDAQSTSTFS